MDFQKLKELARRLGGVLVMDGNTPEFVVLPYESYERTTLSFAPPSSGATAGEEAMIENLNKEIEALKEEIRQKETAELV